MICKNCGATITDTDRCCPYCGTDIFEKSKTEHDQILTEIEREEEKIRQMPKKVANRTTKYLVIASVCFVVVGLLIAAIAYGIRTASVKMTYNNENKLAKQMEELYQVGDYKTISESMEKVNSSNRALAKYEHVRYFYNRYEYATERFEEDLEFAEKLKKSDTISSLNYFLEILYKCDVLEANGYVYEEETVVMQYRKLTMEYMLEHMCLQQEEIEEFYNRYLYTIEEYDRNSNYTYELREKDRESIDADAAELIYMRLVEGQ